ncbi:MAG: type II 3-dehydroquinate dehydratase [Methylacidiphilales bacterium]|nr:type II 3-dehydroquinate dehydratase [Candidatus Methylacidiphilales bacterium]
MKKILVLNGPNLSLLGIRETGQYGTATLQDIEQKLHAHAKTHSIQLICKQSNSEQELIESIHSALHNNIDGIIINAAALTHTSIAIRDALLAVQIPFIEVHLSNIYSRESFRHTSLLADKAWGVITGFGMGSYLLALEAFISYHVHKMP